MLLEVSKVHQRHVCRVNIKLLALYSVLSTTYKQLGFLLGDPGSYRTSPGYQNKKENFNCLKPPSIWSISSWFVFYAARTQDSVGERSPQKWCRENVAFTFSRQLCNEFA